MRSLFAMTSSDGHAWLSFTKNECNNIEVTEITIDDSAIRRFLEEIRTDNDAWLRRGQPSVLFERVFNERDDQQIEEQLAFDSAKRFLSLVLQHNANGSLKEVREYNGQPHDERGNPCKHRYTLLHLSDETDKPINSQNVRLLHSPLLAEQYVHFLYWIAKNAVEVRMLLNNPV